MTSPTPAPPEAKRDPAEVLKDIRAKSKMIDNQRGRRNSGEFKSVNDAIALQRTLRERERLHKELPPLRLVAT